MTQEVYQEPLRSFKTDATPAAVYTVPLLAKGRAALEEINEELGLGFDEWDKEYYLHMFIKDLKRDPTSVELFDMAQSNSEHRSGSASDRGRGQQCFLTQVTSTTCSAVGIGFSAQT